MVHPTGDLLRTIECGKLEQAEKMDDISRALAGAALFDALRDRLAWGVLIDTPGADEFEVRRQVRRRLDAMRSRGAQADE